MTNVDTQHSMDDQSVVEVLRQLEARLARVETHLGLPPLEAAVPSVATAFTPAPVEERGGIEQRIGEFGLAWVGSIVLFLGLVFLMTYLFILGHPLSASGLGYLAAGGMFLLARYWRATIPHISRLTLNSGFLLLFYTTMRLHFFSSSPLLGNAYIALALLLLVVALELWVAWRTQAQTLAGLALLSGMLAALLIDRTHVGLPLLVALCGLAVWLTLRRQWPRLLLTSIIAVYAAHLLWLLSNPLLGHPLQGVAQHQNNLVYLFLYAALFAVATLLQPGDVTTDVAALGALLLNCLGFNVLTLLVVLTHFQQRYATVYLCVAALFLLLSITQWLRTHQQFVPAVYACFGFMALSVAIYNYTDSPAAFFWLSLQSLLVVSLALWFRSKLLVVINALIFSGILLVYLVTAPASNLVNFTFLLVAHATARILNWQQERLTLRTDALRLVYLGFAFFLVLYALYQAVPSQYVTLSWTAASVTYFALSHLLHNVRYRWMAMGVLLVAVPYLFLIDLARLALEYRIVAFLFLGVMVLGISLFYTRIRQLLGKSENAHH